MTRRTPLALSLALASTLACNTDAPRKSAEAGAEPAPLEQEEPAVAAEPAVEPEVGPAVEPEVAPAPEPDPELDDRKRALASVGRGAFDALKAGDFEALLALTPIAEGPLRDACPSVPKSDRRELEARFKHCHEAIDWDAVSEAQAFAGHPSGAQASGCEDGIEDYGRLQVFLHMKDAKIWRVDFFGAVGQDGNAVGINGEVACKQVDEAPPLK